MAYAQQPRYGAAQRYQNEHQQLPYAHQHQPHTAEYDFAPVDQGAVFNGRDSAGTSRQFPTGYESDGGVLAHDRERWQRANRGDYEENGNHGSRGRYIGGGPSMQQSWQIPVDGASTDSCPRIRGPPRSRSRPPERNRPQEINLQYQPNGYQDARGYQERKSPEQGLENALASQPVGYFEFNTSDRSHQNHWEEDRHDRPFVSTSREFHEPRQNPGHQGPDYEAGDRARSRDKRAAAPVVPNTRYQEPSGSSEAQPPHNSSRSETSKRSKASSKRTIETPMSPDTVAWDNPFPTFPMRPKKGAHSSSRSLDGSVAEPSIQIEKRNESNYDSRPQTASSKSSSYTIPQPQRIDETTSNPLDHYDGNFDRRVRTRMEAEHVTRQHEPRSRENVNVGVQLEQLKPQAVYGRQSEDNRTRPSIPVESASYSNYERSRTMPTAMSEAALKQTNRPRPPVQTDWQEPGPVASYYGPEDRGFTPTSSVDPSQRRPYGQPKVEADEERQYGLAAEYNASVRIRNPEARQLHTPQDSLGEVFDNYYDTSPPQDYRLHAKSGESQLRPRADEDMPRFDAAPDPASSHRRGFTLDQHLQSQQKAQISLPMQIPLREDNRKKYRDEPNAAGQFPRSRSQPNLQERRSPGQQKDDGSAFGVAGPSARPPATAPARGEHDPNANGFAGLPNHHLRSMEREPHLKEHGHPRPIPAVAYRNGDRNVPPSMTGLPAVVRQVNGGPDRYYPPPQDKGARGPSPMAYQDDSQPDRYRSPPLQGGRYRPGPTRPPGRPSPNDRNLVVGSLPVSHQNNGRSPVSQDGRFRNGQMRPPDRGPPPTNPVGATSSPVKPPANPDALPSHPAPVRAGLLEGSPVNQAQKPVPVRQYDAIPSPMQLSEPSPNPGSSRPPKGKQESVPITHQELDRLKQSIARNPNDLATQLVLAKKLVEAASVLVDERTDPRTRSKEREKFTVDAHKIVKRLVGNGYTEGTFYLADCYTRGAIGLEPDTREAFKLYQTAAKAGHAQAAYRVAVCCEIGQEEGGGTSRDAVKAMQWYKRAATLGDTPAMYKMGIISLKGLLGQPKNPREAIVWLKRAAERADMENPHALHELALLHEKPNGNDGVPKDEAYSKQLFTQAAKLGYKFSQYRLGCAYEYGLMGYPVDPRQSIAWYSKAAVQEEHQSELALSGWYLTGSEGILQQSDTEAYLWARKAALAGLAKAEYAMGYFTEVGIGAPTNLEDAKRWYWKAASQSFPKARERLEDLRRGGPTKRKERVSRSNMRKSSEGECMIM